MEPSKTARTLKKSRPPRPAKARRPSPRSAPRPALSLIQRARHQPGSLSGRDLLQLQPLVGNRAVRALLRRRPGIQARLSVTPAGDLYEREADRVARQVVRRLDQPEVPEETTEAAGLRPGYGVEEARVSRRPSAVQAGLETGGELAEDVESAIERQRGRGRPMAPAVRQGMESAFGADLGGVRIHTDTGADRLSRALQARAFTTRGDLFFRGGAYRPESPDGRSLLAHELVHVIQQGGARVGGQTIQRVFEPAVANQSTTLRRPEKGKISTGLLGSFRAWRKALKAGDALEADTDDSMENGLWIKARKEGDEGYVRRTDVFLPGEFQEPVEAKLESETLAQSGEFMEQAAKFPSAAASIRKAESAKPSERSERINAELEASAGVFETVGGLLAMIESAKGISRQNDRWANLKAGFGFVESTTAAAASANTLVDSMAKAVGHKEGVQKTKVVDQYTSVVSDALGAVKNSAIGLITLYKLGSSESSQKGKDAAIAAKQLAGAAVSAAKVAKDAYELIGSAIPPGLAKTIPGLGVIFSVIDLLIRFADAVTAEGQRGRSSGEADALRPLVAGLFHVDPPDVDPSSPLFDRDRRGTFPFYRTYFRVKKSIRQAVKKGRKTAKKRLTDLAGHNRTERRDRSVARRAYRAVLKTIDEGDFGAEIKTTIKAFVGERQPPAADKDYSIQKFEERTLLRLAYLDTTIDRYEIADKLAEINQKRETAASTDIGLALVSLAGDVVTLGTGPTGVGAIVGQALKASSSAYKAAHGAARFIQKSYRDRAAASRKSTATKHEEYVDHAHFVFSQIAGLDPGDPGIHSQVERITGYLQAAGVNLGLFYATADPAGKVEMLVNAMKRR